MIGYSSNLGAGIRASIRTDFVEKAYTTAHEIYAARAITQRIQYKLQLFAAIAGNKKVDPTRFDGDIDIGTVWAILSGAVQLLTTIGKTISDISILVSPTSTADFTDGLNKAITYANKLGKLLPEPSKAQELVDTYDSVKDTLGLPSLDELTNTVRTWIVKHGSSIEKMLDLGISTGSKGALDPNVAYVCKIDLRGGIDGGNDVAPCYYRIGGPKGKPCYGDDKAYRDGLLEKCVAVANLCQYGGVYDPTANVCRFDGSAGGGGGGGGGNAGGGGGGGGGGSGGGGVVRDNTGNIVSVPTGTIARWHRGEKTYFLYIPKTALSGPRGTQLMGPRAQLMGDLASEPSGEPNAKSPTLPAGAKKGSDIVPLAYKWWFWGLVIVGVGGAGYGVYRWKFKK